MGTVSTWVWPTNCMSAWCWTVTVSVSTLSVASRRRPSAICAARIARASLTSMRRSPWLIVRTKSCRTSATRQPSAEVIPGRAGTSTWGIASSRASATAWSGPAPPKAKRTKSRGSRPRWSDTRPDGAGHPVVGHAHDRRSRGHGIERQGRADFLVDDLPHLVEPGPSLHTEERVGIQASQEEVGVGDRRLLAAAAVGDGPGLGTRALRSHLEDPRARHARDRAAARADGVDVDHRHADGEAVAHFLVRAHRGRAADDHADVEAGAAHVARDHVGVAGP